MDDNAEAEANADADELRKFAELADRWWDPKGAFRTLQDINPLRLDYIEHYLPLSGCRVADVGCGGGILAEGMAGRGALVVGVDMAAPVIEVARNHAAAAGLNIDYRVQSAEGLAATEAGQFDLVACMELLEHVPYPEATIAACARLVKPDGHVVLSTINRTRKAFALAVVGAEYVLGLIPRGTHRYAKFIRPAELAAWCRSAGLTVTDISGMAYNPLTKQPRRCRAVDVNYLMHCLK